MDAPEQQPNVVKVRLGLGIICAVVVIAVVLGVVIEGAVGKAVMFAVAGVAVVRAYLLTRSLRQDRRSID